MKKLYPLENAINFLRKGIAVSLLILLSVTTHSNSIDKNTARKTAYGFLLEKPSVPLPNSKREDVYSYAENTAVSSKAETVALAGRSDNEAPLPPPPEADSYEPNNTPETATVFTAIFDNNHTSTIDILNVNCHLNTDLDFYKINLQAGYLYTVSGVLFDGYNDFNHYTLDAKISYSTNGSAWSNTEDSQLSNFSVQGVTLYFKIQPYTIGTGTYAARIDIKKAATTGCTYVLSPVRREVASTAGTAQQVSVTTAPSCLWSATSNDNWITLTSDQSATGSGTVVYSYAAYTGSYSRTGTITIADQIHTVTQLPPSLTPDAFEGANGNNTPEEASSLTPVFTANAATLSISPANCHQVGDVDFYKINLEADYNYTVSGSLYDQYNQTGGSSYTLNAGSSYSTDGSNWVYWGDSQLSNRSVPGGGTLYFKIASSYGGQVGTYAAAINISRTAGCTFVFSPVSKVATSEAGTGQISVTASASCTSSWTATVPSSASWITLTSGHSGTTGSGVVVYSYTGNESLYSREGTITIGDQTYTVTQLPAPLTPDGYEGNNGNNTLAQAYSFTPVFTQNASTVSISPANCHLGTDIDFYKINLEAGYSYSFSGEIYDKWSANRNHTLYVKSYYSTDGSNWIEMVFGRLSLRAVTGGSLYLKIEPSTAGYTGTYAARTDIKIESTVACIYGLPVTRVEVTAEEGLNQQAVLTVAAGQSCFWTATSNVDWITLTSGQSGTGPGNVGYSYRANWAPASRTGIIFIAGQTYTLTQAGRPLAGDSYEVNNTLEQASELTASFTQNVSTVSMVATCHNAEDVDFYKIILETGYVYNISGMIYDSGNKSYHNNNYTVDVKSNYSTNGTTWNYWGDSQLSSLTIQGGTLYFKIEPFYPGDTGTYGAGIEIKKTGTVGCTYTLPVTSRGVTWEAGTDQQAALTTGSSDNLSCIWTATSNVSWIRITSGQSGTGNGQVVYSYDANTNQSARTGILTIADKSYTVTQSIQPDAYEGNTGNNTPAQASLLTATFTDNASTVSISPANCHNTTDVDYYKIILEAGYHYTVSGTLYDSYNQTDNNRYTLDAKISASTNGTTWSNQADTQLSNLDVQGGSTLYFKIEPYFSGTGNYAARINLTRDDCTYSLSPDKQATTESGNDQITVTAGSSCTTSWTATTTANWITFTSGQNGTGSGSVGYSYTANEAVSSRTGMIMIAGLTYTIIQAGRPLTADSYEVNNTVAQASELTTGFTQNASTVSISANCHNVEDEDFYKINLEAGYTYTISGILYDTDNNATYNNNYTLNVRSYYSTNATASVIVWNEWGDTQSTSVTVQGGTTLYFKVQPFSSEATGTYGAKIDLTRVVNCIYNLSPDNKQATMEAGGDQITVTTGSSCTSPWTATTTANWITITSGLSGTGSGSVGYSYRANMATEPRTGLLTIAGRTYTLTQAGRPLVEDSYEVNNTVDQAAELTGGFTQNTRTVSISANYHNNSDMDFYKIILEAGYTYTVSGVLYDTDNNTAHNNNYTLNVRSYYSTDAATAVSTWQEWGDRQLTIQGTLYFKIQPYYQGRTGTYGAKIEIKKIATAGCTYTLPATGREVTGEAGTNQQAAVTTSSPSALSCIWTATSNATWITLTSGQSGTGNGQVVYSYEANTTTSSRAGTITIADKLYTVTQGIQPDGYEENNTSAQAWSFTPVFTENASTVSISAANFHHTTDVDFYKIILDDRYSYTVSGALYDLYNQINNSSYTLNAKISYSSDGSVWSREDDKQVPIMTVPGGILYLKIVPYTAGSMGSYAAGIEIKKAAKVGCTYALSALGKEVSSMAGEQQAGVVTAGESCLWTATSNVDWITLISGRSTTGSGTVAYSYNANTGWALRTGTISMAGRTYTVTQLPPPLTPDGYEVNNIPAQARLLTATTFTQNKSTVSISEANCHNVADVDFYKINLEAGYRYTIGGALHDLSNQTSGSNYTLDVQSYYSTDGSNWSFWGDRQLSTLTVQGSETLYLKILHYQEGRVGTYGARIEIDREARCTYSFAPKIGEVTAVAATARVTVTPSSSCNSSWGAITSASWITLTSGHSGTTGSGFVDYSYTTNTGWSSREGTITIADQTYKVTQLPPSLQPDTYEGNNTLQQAYSFTPVFTQNASTFSISPANCHLVNDVDFYKINLESGYLYAVNLALSDGQNESNNYTLDAKVYYSTDGSVWSEGFDSNFSTGVVSGGNLYIKIEPWSQGRVGTYAATIDINITGGCSNYMLSATGKQAGAPGGTGKIDVITGTLCSWTAASNVTWITVPPQSGATGSGSVDYSYQENIVTETRTGSIMVAGQTYNVQQAAAPACTFTLSAPADVTAAAGTGSVAVGALRSNCVWTATSNVEWITVPPRSGATGSGSVAYSYRENIVTEARTGTIMVAGQTYTVHQAAAPACTFTLSAPADVTAAAGAGSVTVGALRRNCAWTATSGVEWITVPPQSGATGSGNVAYSYRANMVTEARTGTIMVAGQTYNVHQAAATACTFTLSAPADVTAAAGSGSVTVTALRSNCAWTAISGVEWITVPPQSGATGSGSVAYSYRANIETEARTGTIMVAGQTYNVHQAGATACTFTLSAPADVTAAAGSGSITVTAIRSNCTWTATSGVEWITVPPQSGATGSGSVAYSYRANIETEARTGTIMVAGQTYTVNQAAAAPACTFTLSAPANVSAAAGTGSITVTALRSNCTWTATSNVSWITVPPQSGATGSGSVAYSYQENIVTEARTGTLMVAGQTYTVNQAAAPASCTFTLSSSPANVTAAAGSGSVTVTALPGNCAWTATSNVSWITVPPQSGATGSGSVDYSYQANIETEARTGTLTVAGQTYTVNQAQAAAATACTFTLSSSPANVTAAAGTGSVTVTALPGNCAWTATSNVEWITVPPRSGATGSGSVAYTYRANILTEARTGTLMVAGQTYTVNQAAAATSCTFTLSSSPANVTAAAGTGSVTVTALPGNCAWTATSNVEWITVPPRSGATGSGSVAYTYRENIETEARTGTLMVAGQTYTVNQEAASACTLTLSAPADVTAAAGRGSIMVTPLRSNCTWTATSNADWITLTSGQSGTTGSGSVGYFYTENKTAASRTGTITVANQTYTVNQAAATACTFTLSLSADNVTAAAGAGSLSVIALPGDCAWTAASNVEWITLSSGQSETTGSGKVDYSYTENKTALSRTGTITIANQTFTLTQSIVTGIEPIGHVRIFPNPAGDFVTVDLSAGNVKYVSLKIVSQFGQTLYERNNPNQTLQIPLKGFANGLYFIQIQGEEKVWVEKLIIKH